MNRSPTGKRSVPRWVRFTNGLLLLAFLLVLLLLPQYPYIYGVDLRLYRVHVMTGRVDPLPRIPKERPQTLWDWPVR